MDFETPWAAFLYCWSFGAVASAAFHWFLKPILSIGVIVRHLR